jgi:hypothetical protein
MYTIWRKHLGGFMILGIKFNKNLMDYILNKLAALGLLVFVMCLYIILATGFDLYEFSENILNIKIWGLICGYALMTTLLIDLVTFKWIEIKYHTRVLLHCLAGFLVFFLITGVNLFSVIAGSVGALCAFIYIFGSSLLKKRKQLVWIFLLVFPLMLCIRLFDFTIKEGWTEEKTNSNFSAEFERFNGKNEIPIFLNKGEVVTFYISFEQLNGGGYGYHILDEKGEYVGVTELEDTYEEYRGIDTNTIQFNAEKAGVYMLIVTGDNLKGKIDIKWEIN